MTLVYLCDDERDYRSLVKAVLATDDDMQVIGECGDGHVCIADVSEHASDVLLLDVNMPGLGGMDALPQLHAAAPETQIIILTSAPASDYQAKATELGAVGVIEKPVNIFDLPDLIRATLAHGAQEP